MDIVNHTGCDLVPTHKLVRHPRNPNTHPEEQLRLLAKIIDRTGWRHPIVVSNRSGFIIFGHARLTVAERLELDKVPVQYQDWPNEAQEWADLLADNRIAELAEMDRPMLKDLLQEMDTGALDMELTGYSDRVLEAMMLETHQVEPPYGGTGVDDRSLTFMDKFGFASSSVWVDLTPASAETWPYLIHPPENKAKNAIKYNYSRANPVAIERMIKLWAEPGDYYYEPCSGWGTFSAIAKYFGHSGEMVDNWETAYKFGIKTMEAMPGTGKYKAHLADAADPPVGDGVADFIQINPPFGNLEIYGGESAGSGKYENWLESMRAIMAANKRVLKPGKFMCVVIADWREGGKLMNGHGDMIGICEGLGFKLHDLIICKLNTVATFFARKYYEQKHMVKSHEYILVFKRGDE